MADSTPNKVLAADRQTLHEALSVRAISHSTQLAVADPDNRAELLDDGSTPRRLTFAELDRAAARLAERLHGIGVGRADVIVVQLPNIVELAICYFAVSRLGAILSPLPMQYRSHEITTICATISPKVAITCSRFKGDQIAQQWRHTAVVEQLLVVGEQLDFSAAPAPATSYPLACDGDATITLCWTSGTTGTPKAVPRSHAMWVASSTACIEAGGYRSGDRLLNPFPLVNMAAIGSFLYPMVLCGCSLILHHPLDAPLFMHQLASEQITYTVAPPALLNQLAKNPPLWQQLGAIQLRAIGSGSAPLSGWMITTFERDYGVPIVNLYGSNEGITLFSTQHNCPDPELRASQFPLPTAASGLRCALIDIDSGEQIKADGVTGELLFSGPTVFNGYAGQTELECFIELDGVRYFRTGDLVELAAGGRQLRVVGRCKELINRGGEKISPAELDQLLEQLNNVAEVACYGYPDQRLGERVAAAVVVADGHRPPTLTELCDYLELCGVAKTKWPEQLNLVAALPRNPLGKVERFALAA